VEGGRLFDVQVPVNWRSVASNNAVKFTPENGYGVFNGETVFTHGAEFGVAAASSRDLVEATRTLVTAFRRGNPELRQQGALRQLRLSGRTAIGVPLENRSALGGVEHIGLYTTFLADGNLFYVATVVPEAEASAYDAAFSRVVATLRLRDAR
jgi:hypothetical protein